MPSQPGVMVAYVRDAGRFPCISRLTCRRTAREPRKGDVESSRVVGPRARTVSIRALKSFPTGMVKSSQVKSSKVVGLRDCVVIIRTLISSSPHPYAGSGEVWLR